MSEELLAGLLVIDLSERVSGSYCCKLLVDCGAEVIKVERPGAGDPSRAHGPFPADLPHSEKSALFLYLNAGKKGITLDISQATGALLLRRLIEQADALVENLTPGYLGSLGLDYQELSRPNPRLLMTSITPFGRWGPYASYRSSNLAELAAGGQMRLSGEQHGQPVQRDGYEAEYQAGLNAFTATLVGLVGVAVSEMGQHIDVAGMECLAAASLPTGDTPSSSLIGLGGLAETTESLPAADRPGLQEVEHPLAGRLAYPPAPFRTSRLARMARAPLLGEHNEEVYCRLLGLSRQDMLPLRAAGII